MTDSLGQDHRRLVELEVDTDAVSRALLVIANAIRTGGKVLVFGNGGSAADAQHFAAELVGRFEVERPGLAAIALTTDSSALTAIANDYGFERVFSRQVQALGRPGDVALAISTSGRSANVLAGIKAAREAGLLTIGLCGSAGCQLCGLADVAIVAPSHQTATVQEVHLVIEHAICRALDRMLVVDGGLMPETPSGTVVSMDELVALRSGWRASDQTVVWTNGCFDVLHAGHLASLRSARELGDILVVGLNDDASVRRLKGPGRPVVPGADRSAVLAALRHVDYVVLFAEDTPEIALKQVQPDIACKGADYGGPNGKAIPERAVVEAGGGRIAILPLLPGRSTTQLLEGTARVDG